MIRTATAAIDTQALQHNLQRVKQLAPRSRIMAVIKADAYGHGLLNAARALDQADGFAVASLNEAAALRQAGVTLPICVFQGFLNAEQLKQMAALELQPVIHQHWQIDMLEAVSLDRPLNAWLKVDTGMGRLGLPPDQADACWQRLRQCSRIGRLGLMSHFANADVPGHDSNRQQIERFNALARHLDAHNGLGTSLSNSAGLTAFAEAQGDWVRPGIMLYGSSPILDTSAADLDLRPVMQLTSKLIAINHRRKGDVIGYGSQWQCPEDMPVGVVAIGYGDGYPRHARMGTPVWLRGQRAPLVGRVSMDLLTLDLRSVEQPECGDEVVLWGRELSVDVIAEHAQTIAYELLCKMASCRVDP